MSLYYNYSTGTGKTYTMLGTDSQPGIMVLTLNDLFRRMEEDQHVMKYRATIAYLEVRLPYMDMLSQQQSAHIQSCLHSGLHFLWSLLTRVILYFTPGITAH